MGVRVTRYDGWDELDWPEKALEAGYCVKALAGLLGEEVRRFRRKFHRYFDRPPKEQFLIWRAARADQLNTAGLSIGEIARQLHYTDRSHFGREHKRRHGVSALRRRAAEVGTSPPRGPT